MFPDEALAQVHLERFIALLAATGDAYHEVSGMGDDGLKRIKQPDLEDKTVVNRIYQMYQGSNRKPASGMYQMIVPPPTQHLARISRSKCLLMAALP